MQQKYPHLLSPYKIGKFTFKNRMLAAPMGCGRDNVDGYMHEDNIRMFEEVAKGGAARVVTSDNPVNYETAGYRGFRRLHFYNEKRPETNKAQSHVGASKLERSVREYVRGVHRHGALAFMEFIHQGVEALDTVGFPPAEYIIGPSAFIREADGKEVREMDEAMMQKVIDDFVLCIRKSKDFGVDGILIHGGHGFLIQQFLSRRANKRMDKYGGSLENRARFPLMLIKSIKECMGDDMIFELRLSGEEFIEDGITIDETVEFCKMIDGIVDIIHISAGVHLEPVPNLRVASSCYMPVACNADMAAQVKKAVKKSAVAVVGAINDPDVAEELIASGKVDFVLLARQLMCADPCFPRKVMEGRPELINTCVRCYGCANGEGCTVNPVTQLDFKYDLNPPKANTSRKVVVVGGGIGGLKAAATAAERGHDVVLFEKTGALGGILNFTDDDVVKVDLRRYKNYMAERVRAMENIDIRLNTEATPEMIEELEPFAVIAAVGSHPIVPKIPGIDGKNVMGALDMYRNFDKVGNEVVIVGGGLVGCECGLHMARQGKKVTVVEMVDTIAQEISKIGGRFDPLVALTEAMREAKVHTRTWLTCTEIFEGGVKAVTKDGAEVVFKADTVIYAVGMRADRAAAEKLMGLSPLYSVIGDCAEVGTVRKAVSDAYYAALDI